MHLRSLAQHYSFPSRNALFLFDPEIVGLFSSIVHLFFFPLSPTILDSEVIGVLGGLRVGVRLK